MEEVWKDIPGYEGKYQASSLGRIRSLDRYVRLVAHGTETKRLSRGRVLKPGRMDKSGRLSVTLGRGTNGKTVHQLVALTFLGPRPKGLDICHKDGDPSNNAIENLRYDTRRENILDVYRQGKRWRKLSKDDLLIAKQLIDDGIPAKEIALKLGVTTRTIYDIKGKRRGLYTWLP